MSKSFSLKPQQIVTFSKININLVKFKKSRKFLNHMKSQDRQMVPLKIKEIIKATEGDLISGNPLLKVRGISTNTRALLRRDLFIALKGEKFDGHVFLGEALERGAAGAVVSRDGKIQNTKYKNKIIIKVDNTLKALGNIAKTYREKFNITVIAITGSNW